MDYTAHFRGFVVLEGAMSIPITMLLQTTIEPIEK
jgi:hypothetical protein